MTTAIEVTGLRKQYGDKAAVDGLDNGSMLGMKRREIVDRFDEIVAFAGVQAFLETPVKHYSSGMQMRLAFAVAAHLEAHILLVDEVLAVGDAEFQRRCIGKIWRHGFERADRNRERRMAGGCITAAGNTGLRLHGRQRGQQTEHNTALESDRSHARRRWPPDRGLI